jgi:predicted lipoprotein
MPRPRLGLVVRGDDQPLRVSADELLAELRNPDGRSVVLLARTWEDKITQDHPELRAHLEHVLVTVTRPDHAEPDPRA